VSKRSLVMLADTYDPLKFKPNGSYVSEKLDGIRALWLPFTAGHAFKTIPWANTARDDRDYVCSGLWTRRGKPIMAPPWWVESLPMDIPLDGELFIGRNLFQDTMSVVRKLDPIHEEWERIKYHVFDIPSYSQFFTTGQIREGGRAGDPAYEVFFKISWAAMFREVATSKFWPVRRFSDNYSLLLKLHQESKDSTWVPVKQSVLPATHDAAENGINELLSVVTDMKGEGLMLRRPHSIWEPKRSPDLVKVKPLLDDEAMVIGYTYGKGKFRGMVGALRVRWNPVNSQGPVIFDLSGLTERERELLNSNQESIAMEREGEYTEESVSRHFPIGSVVTFQYNDVTKDGLPRFARYYRKRTD
jgi:DNA ligase-1